MDLVGALPGVNTVHRYGVQGSKQKGIDLYADLESGDRWTFQCRQWKRFTKANAEKTIRENAFTAAKHFIVIACDAGTGVRDVCLDKPDWDIWDIHDVSHRVRALSLHRARSLLETYFGSAWRKAFLGVSGLTPFVPPKLYFQHLVRRTALFNHTWTLVGRKDLLSGLKKFAQSQHQRIAFIVGRGGIGKTKILQAFATQIARSAQKSEIYFGVEGVPITPESLDELPAAPCVVVLDDAHRAEGLQMLLAYAQQRSHPLKLVLALRPQGIEELMSRLARAGFDAAEIYRPGELKELSRAEVKTLARQALGKRYAHLSDLLAAATKDCPLVTVVGGQLLAKKSVSPKLLERHGEFRDVVLSRFRDALLGDIPGVDRTICQSLLPLVAAIGPVQSDDRRFQEVAAEFLGVDQPRLVSTLGMLEQAGILVKRGFKLRIVPDVLADHLLYTACLTSQGQPTGYAEQVFGKFRLIAFDRVLRNLAELDWRIRYYDERESHLLDNIWLSIQKEFRKATQSGRCVILGLLKGVAYYQPLRVLDLVELCMSHPAQEDAAEGEAHQYHHTHEDVLRELPELLRQIAFTTDYLPRCCDLLWELGRDDRRQLNSHPGHAIRILQDIAGYDLDKSFAVNAIVVASVGRWLDAPDAHAHAHSPLDVLDPLFEKSAYTARSEGHAIQYISFLVPKDRTASIRADALALIKKCALSGNPQATLRAIESLGHALQGPQAYFNLQISKEQHEQWIPDRLTVLDLLGEIAVSSKDSLVHLRILQTVKWEETRSSYSPVRARAQGDNRAMGIPEYPF